MKMRYLLTATGTLLLALPPAHAGNRAGGTGSSAVTIPADTLGGGGGTATGGSGASAVAVTASLGGIVGTAIAASPATSNQQGLIPQLFGLAGFELWATANIPVGQDRTFGGDWNQDGIPNGVAYVFGNARITSSAPGRIAVPPASRADVDVRLDWSNGFVVWLPIASWLAGAGPSGLDVGVSIVGGEVVDTQGGPNAFYRYRVVKR